mgnify:CR=1 FL=1|jgi:hypothetical protein
MPRVGDPDADWGFKVFSELGYRASIVGGIYLDAGINNGYDDLGASQSIAATFIIGTALFTWNFMFLALDKFGPQYARPDGPGAPEEYN